MDQNRRFKRKHLAEILMADLEARRVRSGGRLPTVRKLAADWQVSPLTVTRLLNDLAAAGKLRRERNRGYFLAEDFPPKPHIGFIGSLPPPEGRVREYIHDEAVRALFDELERLRIQPEIFNYADFSVPGRVPVKLTELNGLLIEGSFFDNTVAGKLHDFAGPVVVFDGAAGGGTFVCSRVFTDYRRTLNRFFELCPLSPERKYLIVRAGHENAGTVAELLRYGLREAGLPPPEEIVLGGGVGAEMEAMEYFQEHRRDWRETLIFSLSGYYTRGLWAALHGAGPLPDVLSFDNLEARVPIRSASEGYFTSIERNLPRMYRRAVRLLRDQIVNRSDEIEEVGVHASLVIRKSVRGIDRSESRVL